MLISGEISIDDKKLTRRDAVGISKTINFTLNADQDAEVLFIEVPMEI
jgi:redox-sensitive bicupin YhaK (pirin superfamily)